MIEIFSSDEDDDVSGRNGGSSKPSVVPDAPGGRSTRSRSRAPVITDLCSDDSDANSSDGGSSSSDDSGDGDSSSSDGGSEASHGEEDWQPSDAEQASESAKKRRRLENFFTVRSHLADNVSSMHKRTLV